MFRPTLILLLIQVVKSRSLLPPPVGSIAIFILFFVLSKAKYWAPMHHPYAVARKWKTRVCYTFLLLTLPWVTGWAIAHCLNSIWYKYFCNWASSPSRFEAIGLELKYFLYKNLFRTRLIPRCTIGCATLDFFKNVTFII